jgi:hypothetical protein
MRFGHIGSGWGFDVVNAKLDKCGGLTEAFAMAPAYLLGQLCRAVNLDGPVFLDGGRTPSAQYSDGLVTSPAAL